MSRAKPVSEREALDFYATPQALADAICEYLGRRFLFAPCVIEPSAGHGPFVRAARQVWPEAEITAIDVCVERVPELEVTGANAVLVSDWLQIAALPQPRFCRLIVGNPPFRDAEEHIRHALTLMEAGDSLAFLLRLNFLGSRDRLDFWRLYPPAEVTPIVPRPSFTGGGSDATEYALFRWDKGHRGPTTLSMPLVWEKSRAAASPLSSGGR